MTDTTASDNSAGNATSVNTSTAAITSAPATAPVTTAPSWLGADVDEVTLGYVQNKGWNEPRQVLDGYRNLEKLLGADKAGNAVVLPKADATPEELSAFYARLGRPEKPDGYKLAAPEGLGDPQFAAAAAAKFHELGLSGKQGEALAQWFSENTGAKQAQMQQQTQAAFQADSQALAQEWGAAFDQNVGIARKAVQGLGLEAADVDKIAGAIGHKATMQLFQKIGTRVMEDTFVAGNGKSSGFGDAMTPGQAKSEIQMLQQDKAFVSKYLSKDSEAVSKMTRLMKFAYPE